MTTTRVELSSTYTQVTTEDDFIAQNVSPHIQEWVRASSAPTESVSGLIISPENGLTSTLGTGTPYARGKGSVVVVT